MTSEHPVSCCIWVSVTHFDGIVQWQHCLLWSFQNLDMKCFCQAPKMHVGLWQTIFTLKSWTAYVCESVQPGEKEHVCVTIPANSCHFRNLHFYSSSDKWHHFYYLCVWGSSFQICMIQLHLIDIWNVDICYLIKIRCNSSIRFLCLISAQCQCQLTQH